MLQNIICNAKGLELQEKTLTLFQMIKHLNLDDGEAKQGTNYVKNSIVHSKSKVISENIVPVL